MIETKEYSDGDTASGIAPLPIMSPRQQDTVSALAHLNTIEEIMGGRNGPSIRLRALISRLRSIEVTPTFEGKENEQ